MADYIKREDAINTVKRIPGLSYGPNGPTDCFASSGLLDPSWVIHELQMIPAADVREIVEDCGAISRPMVQVIRCVLSDVSAEEWDGLKIPYRMKRKSK